MALLCFNDCYSAITSSLAVIYCKVLITNEMHNSYNQFYATVFCLLYMFRTNLVVHQEHGIIYCITQYNQYSRAVKQCVYDQRDAQFL